MGNLVESLQKLSSFLPEGMLVTSLYLDLGPENRQNRKYLITFKDMVKEKKEEMEKRDLKREVRESVEEDFRRIEEFLSDPENLKNCRGIGIFSCSKRKLFEYIKLPYVYRNRLSVSEHPLLREVASIDEEFGRIGILLIDRKHARYFRMDIDSLSEVVNFMEPLATRSHKFHSGGASLKGAEGTFKMKMPARVSDSNMVQHSFGEWRFHMRIKNEWHSLLKVSADAVFEDWKETKFDKLIIGGVEKGKIREIENHLHPYLKDRLTGYIVINPSTAKESEIREKVFDLIREKDREEEKKLIYELKELEGRGLAVNGTEKVLDMLNMGNVRTVLIPENFEMKGYVCSKTKVLGLRPECPLNEEEPIEILDIADEVIEEALSQKAIVKVIVDKDLQKEVDGLGAFLRFSI